MPDVPAVVRRLERDAQKLRRREAEIAKALVDAGIGGAVGRVVLEPGYKAGAGPDELAERRLRAISSLRSAREKTAHRLSTAVAALESLRLSLLQLRAGVGTIDDLSEDIERARSIEAEIDAEIEGRAEVEDLLGN